MLCKKIEALEETKGNTFSKKLPKFFLKIFVRTWVQPENWQYYISSEKIELAITMNETQQFKFECSPVLFIPPLILSFTISVVFRVARLNSNQTLMLMTWLKELTGNK